MRTFARRWLSGDERTLGAVLVLGVLVMAFFRLDKVRGAAGTPVEPLGLVLVLAALAWWSLLPRAFVWLDPADLTWRDTGDRGALITTRLAGGWIGRQLLLGYLVALLLAAARAPATWAYAGAAALLAAGLLSFGVVRLPRPTSRRTRGTSASRPTRGLSASRLTPHPTPGTSVTCPTSAPTCARSSEAADAAGSSTHAQCSTSCSTSIRTPWPTSTSTLRPSMTSAPWPSWVEAVAVLVVAGFAGVVMPGPVVVVGLAIVLVVAAVPLVRFGRPPVADAGRTVLVDGWRDRVSRVAGIQFLDLALLLPAARPVRPRPLTSGLWLAWLGVLGRARHAPTAVLLAVTAIAVRRTLPGLPESTVFAVFGYVAVVPLVAGLGELWRSPGRRRWVGLSDTALRVDHLAVAALLAAGWGLPVWLLATWSPQVLLVVPVVAACVIRTMTRKPPTFDNLAPVDTPMGAMPMRLILQTTRGPDLAVPALVLLPALPLWGGVLVVAAALAVAVFR